MAAPSVYLTVVKRFPYRNNTVEEWSNSYALTGATPADSTAWRALFDGLVSYEKLLYIASCQVVAGYGYHKIPVTGDHADWSVDLTITPNTPVNGTLSALGNGMPGDTAAWIRWGLDRFNSRGKRVYLRKYFHAGRLAATSGDLLEAGYITALTSFGNSMRDGSFTGGRKVCDKDGNVPIGSGISPYSTTRTLKRRGKRPPT